MSRLAAAWLTACVILLGSLGTSHAEEAKLRQAYQREFAFLDAERASLKTRLEKLRADNIAKMGAARADVETLQGRVLALASEAERMTEQLLDAERQASSSGDGADQVESTLAQMFAALEKGGVKLPDVKKTSESAQSQLSSGFTLGLELLAEFSTVKKVPGSFFGPQGEELSGSLVKVGQVATYGVSDSAAGALAPAGDGRLKLWSVTPSSESARGVASGAGPSSLGIFLYETLDKGVEEKREKTIRELIDDGGIIGWIIVGIGAVAALMALGRVLLLLRSAANTGRLVQEIAPLVMRHRYQDAIAVCERAKSAAGRVLRATLKHIDRPREELEDIISESILHETPQVDRFGSAIMVVAAVAPLLGLLGTVTGMIATFDIITEFGTGNPKLLSGGISTALVTTELGLIVAIPTLLIGNLLSAWAEGIKDEMDRSALHITNISSGVRLTNPPFSTSPPTPGASLPVAVAEHAAALESTS